MEKILDKPGEPITLTKELISELRTEFRKLVQRAVKARDKSWNAECEKQLPAYHENNFHEPLRESRDLYKKALANLTLAGRFLSGGTRKNSQPYKQQMAIEKYDKDVIFLTEQTHQLKAAQEAFDKAREGQSALRASAPMSEQTDTNSETYKSLVVLDKSQKAGVHTTRALEDRLLAHFNGGQWSTLSNHSPIPAALDIPADVIECNRNDWIMREIPIWAKTRVRSMYTVIPYLNRILNDYNSKTGVYWRAPNIHMTDLIPEVIRETWCAQNELLATLLTSAMASPLVRVVLAPHVVGRDETTVSVDKTDGLAMLASLMTQASPHTSEYKSKIEKNVLQAADKAKSMGNPITFVKDVMEDLLECARLNIPVKWHIGRSIITALTVKHTLFGNELQHMMKVPNDEEDSGPHMDVLMSKIITANNMIIEYEQNPNWWQKSVPSAHMARSSTDPTNNPSNICRFGMNCYKKDTTCKRSHSGNPNKKQKLEHKHTKGANTKQCAHKGCFSASHPKGNLCEKHFKQSQVDGNYLDKQDLVQPVRVNKGLRNKFKKNAHSANAKMQSKKQQKAAKEQLAIQAAADVPSYTPEQMQGCQQLMHAFNLSTAKQAMQATGVPTIQVPAQAQGDTVTITRDLLASMIGKKVTKPKHVIDLNAMSAVGIMIDHNVQGPTSKKQKVKDQLLDNCDILVQASKLNSMILEHTANN